MVMHDDKSSTAKSHYAVIAQLIEPNYPVEYRFVEAELAFVSTKTVKRGPWRPVSIPALGWYSPKDWRRYGHQLVTYAKRLQDYEDEVEDGVLPVKFAVINETGQADTKIQIKVKVKDGRVDEARKAPERPDRLDARGKPWPKLTLPRLGGFARSAIKFTEHGVTAEFSRLEDDDGAALVNQVFHIHCGPQTQVTFEISSANVKHAVGEVELQERVQSAH